MKCNKCNYDNPEDAQFCQHCGTSLGPRPSLSERFTTLKKNDPTSLIITGWAAAQLLLLLAMILCRLIFFYGAHMWQLSSILNYLLTVVMCLISLALPFCIKDKTLKYISLGIVGIITLIVIIQRITWIVKFGH